MFETQLIRVERDLVTKAPASLSHPLEILQTMERQLKLLEPSETEPPEWQLDERTKAAGRRGVAAVRAALEQARRDALRRDGRHNAA